MANITKLFRSGYGIQINYTINSPQNISNNTTSITVKAQLYSDGSSYTIRSSATKNGTLSINGKDYSFTFTAGLSGNQVKTLYTKTLDIPHNSDGTKTLSLGISLGIKVTLSGVYWGTVTHSGSVALPTIPRTSSMSLSTSSATLGSTSVIVTINRASADFTHKVYCKIGSYSKQVNTNKEGLVSIPFTPELAIASEITTSTSGSATVEVQTYNGSTKIGSVTKSLTVNVPSSVVPTIGGFNDTPVSAGAATSYGYVKGLSKSKLTMSSVSGSYGSSIVSYSIRGGGFSTTSSSLTTGILNTPGSITFTAKVTDSRGRTATKTCPITVYGYAVPSISTFTVKRCDRYGNIIDDGTYLSTRTVYTYSSVNNQNTIEASIQYKKSTTTTWSTGVAVSSGVTKVIGGGEITTNSSYDVIITISDKFNSVSRTLVVPTAYAVIDILKGGKGIAIGKVAETSGIIDVGMDLNVNGSGKTQISTSGKSVSWLDGCKGVGSVINVTEQNGYSPILRQKTTDGAWALGTYTANRVYLTYMSDTTMASNTNIVDTQYVFPADGGGTVYTTGNKPSAADVGAYSTSESYSRSHWSLNSNANGYCKMPNGTILQWGITSITPTAADVVTSRTIYFPISFPNDCKFAISNPKSSVPYKIDVSCAGINTASFDLYMTRSNTTITDFYWFAVGC